MEKEADKNHVGLKEDRQGTPKNRKKQTGGGYKSYNHRCNNHRRNYHRKNHQHNEKGHEAEKERDDDISLSEQKQVWGLAVCTASHYWAMALVYNFEMLQYNQVYTLRVEASSRCLIAQMARLSTNHANLPA